MACLAKGMFDVTISGVWMRGGMLLAVVVDPFIPLTVGIEERACVDME